MPYYQSNFMYKGNNVFFIKEITKVYIYIKQISITGEIQFRFTFKKKELKDFNKLQKSLLKKYNKSSIYFEHEENKTFTPYIILHKDDEILFKLENKKV